MDASRIFNDLLNQVESSGLNYIINRTPFSANISIKRTFIKLFNSPSQTEAIVKPNKIDLEKIELREKLVVVQEQKDRFEELLRQEHVKFNSLNCEMGKFKEEILCVKKERNSSISKLKTQQNENIDTKQQSIEMCRVIKDLEEKVKEKNKELKVKNVECQNLKIERIKSEESLKETLKEFNSVKKEKNLQTKTKLKSLSVLIVL